MQSINRNDYSRDNQEPRISLNKLPDFIWGSPVSKEAIVYGQKYPKAWSAGRYTEADNAIAKYFASNQEMEVLDTEIERLIRLQQVSPSKYRPDCIARLRSFRSLAPLDLKAANIYDVPRRNIQTGIPIENVFVSVRPDALVKLESAKGEAYGAVKMYYPQKVLGKDKSECIATLLSMFLANPKLSLGEVDPKYCFSVDVFSGTTFTAPKAHKRMMANVEAACREYDLMWQACKRKD